MRKLIKTIVEDYGWVHLSLGLLGNVGFFVGSILFLPQLEPYKVIGVWLFIVGSFLMLIGSLGRALVELLEDDQ
ncbi:YrhK family protein [Microbulbifer yueqingensis]|uniref:YrhK-like protein n=1 Tax=Microbulbifer yueqingensis TaxID=658219 RepID=A0A1G8Z960_9GAMM|nr:YrhK family protein [Microbulbifer yueqingensis]SDK11588.1 YrhK-like protein [Microbulbifer yueqingensis]